ncbi:unnamed protein product, partial [Amoebophrya sp. A120]|eukprot:GSA120T00020718001.1
MSAVAPFKKTTDGRTTDPPKEINRELPAGSTREEDGSSSALPLTSSSGGGGGPTAAVPPRGGGSSRQESTSITARQTQQPATELEDFTTANSTTTTATNHISEKNNKPFSTSDKILDVLNSERNNTATSATAGRGRHLLAGRGDSSFATTFLPTATSVSPYDSVLNLDGRRVLTWNDQSLVYGEGGTSTTAVQETQEQRGPTASTSPNNITTTTKIDESKVSFKDLAEFYQKQCYQLSVPCSGQIVLGLRLGLEELSFSVNGLTTGGSNHGNNNIFAGPNFLTPGADNEGYGGGASANGTTTSNTNPYFQQSASPLSLCPLLKCFSAMPNCLKFVKALDFR